MDEIFFCPLLHVVLHLKLATCKRLNRSSLTVAQTLSSVLSVCGGPLPSTELLMYSGNSRVSRGMSLHKLELYATICETFESGCICLCQTSVGRTGHTVQTTSSAETLRSQKSEIYPFQSLAFRVRRPREAVTEYSRLRSTALLP